MRNVGRKLASVLASTNHGTMIVNRFDYHVFGPERGIGGGLENLEADAISTSTGSKAASITHSPERYVENPDAELS